LPLRRRRGSPASIRRRVKSADRSSGAACPRLPSRRATSATAAVARRAVVDHRLEGVEDLIVEPGVECPDGVAAAGEVLEERTLAHRRLGDDRVGGESGDARAERGGQQSSAGLEEGGASGLGGTGHQGRDGVAQRAPVVGTDSRNDATRAAHASGVSA